MNVKERQRVVDELTALKINFKRALDDLKESNETAVSALLEARKMLKDNHSTEDVIKVLERGVRHSGHDDRLREK